MPKTHMQIVKEIKPSLVFRKNHGDLEILFSTTYGDGFITVIDLKTTKLMAELRISTAPTLIAIRSVIAKWLLEQGYSE